MTPSRAKEVLEKMRLIRFDSNLLYGKHISADKNFVSLDYILDADQLQAIALWMQDPESVVHADPNPEGEKCTVTSVCHHCHVALIVADQCSYIQCPHKTNTVEVEE